MPVPTTAVAVVAGVVAGVFAVDFCVADIEQPLFAALTIGVYALCLLVMRGRFRLTRTIIQCCPLAVSPPRSPARFGARFSCRARFSRLCAMCRPLPACRAPRGVTS